MKNYGPEKNQRESYNAKEEFLKSKYSWTAPMEFYRDLFGDFLQEAGATSDGRGCAIFRFIPDKSTYQKLKGRLMGETQKDLYKDTEEMMKFFKEFYVEHTDEDIKALKQEEREKKLDRLAQIFHAGKYRKSGERIEADWKFDQRVHNDLSELSEAIGKRTAYMAPISYYGKKANGKNARYLHSITIDLDGVGIQQLRNLVLHFENGILPTPTYLVNSGHGMHLYYILDEPVPLYNHVRRHISHLKVSLCEYIWNNRTSTIKGHRDDQPWAQMYRVVGSMTKLGDRYITNAYKVGDYVSLETLNNFMHEDDRIELPLDKYRPKGKSGYDLEYWKAKNPDWYERRILKKGTADYVAKSFPWLYESLRKRVAIGAKIGNRYHCLCVMFADAALAGIPYQQVYDEAQKLREMFNLGIESEEDEFTQNDVDCAARYYNPDFGKYITLERIEHMTGIRFPRNKRNRNPQEVHLGKYIPAMRTAGLVKDTRFGADGGNDSTKGGRPKGSGTAEQTVREFLQNNPTAKKVDVIKNTGLSKPTVYKYYDKIKEELL